MASIFVLRSLFAFVKMRRLHVIAIRIVVPTAAIVVKRNTSKIRKEDKHRACVYALFYPTSLTP